MDDRKRLQQLENFHHMIQACYEWDDPTSNPYNKWVEEKTAQKVNPEFINFQTFVKEYLERLGYL